jgi:hypothetical protein
MVPGWDVRQSLCGWSNCDISLGLLRTAWSLGITGSSLAFVGPVTWNHWVGSRSLIHKSTPGARLMMDPAVVGTCMTLSQACSLGLPYSFNYYGSRDFWFICFHFFIFALFYNMVIWYRWIQVHNFWITLGLLYFSILRGLWSFSKHILYTEHIFQIFCMISLDF